MLKANYYPEGLCYTNIKNRKEIAYMILSQCYGLFSQASIIQNLDQLNELMEKGLIVNRELSELLWSLYPPIIDAVLISTCFENFFKTELLLKGYIVHNILEEELPNSYKHLKNDQRTRPIKISEIKEAEGLTRKKKRDYEFKSLEYKTINYSVLLEKNNYKNLIKIPLGLFSILKKINRQRNILHLLLPHGATYNKEILNEYKELRDCINKVLIRRRENLRHYLKYPDELSLEPI